MRKPIIRSNVNPLALPHLFFAGRAVLTFRNTEKETHMTVKVKQATDKNDRKIKLPIFFVSVSLLGDRQTGYVFAGTIFPQNRSRIFGTAKAGRNPKFPPVLCATHCLSKRTAR